MKQLIHLTRINLDALLTTCPDLHEPYFLVRKIIHSFISPKSIMSFETNQSTEHDHVLQGSVEYGLTAHLILPQPVCVSEPTGWCLARPPLIHLRCTITRTAFSPKRYMRMLHIGTHFGTTYIIGGSFGVDIHTGRLLMVCILLVYTCCDQVRQRNYGYFERRSRAVTRN